MTHRPRRTPRGFPCRGPATWLAVLVGVCLLTACTGENPSTASAGSPETTPGGAPADEAGPGLADMPGWSPVGGLRTPRDDFVTTVVDDEIWVLGGMTGERGNRLTSIEVFEPDSRTWTTSDIELPRGLASFEGVTVGDRIFVLGGLDEASEPTDFAAVLDTSTGTWSELPALPHERYAHTVTLHEGRIHVIGGESAQGPVPQVDVLDVASMSWSPGAPMPRARGSHDTVSTDAGLYVLGGWRRGAPSRLVQLYDPAAGSWSEAPALPEPMARGGAAVLDDRLWVSYHEFAAVLDLDTGEWTPANHPPLSRHGHGFVALDGAVYAIGGCQESPLRDVRTVDVMVP